MQAAAAAAAAAAGAGEDAAAPALAPAGASLEGALDSFAALAGEAQLPQLRQFLEAALAWQAGAQGRGGAAAPGGRPRPPPPLTLDPIADKEARKVRGEGRRAGVLACWAAELEEPPRPHTPRLAPPFPPPNSCRAPARPASGALLA